MEVHPDFRAIFTSNPEEYAGVHRTQDALLDRLITIKVDYFNRDTEVEITRMKSGLTLAEAVMIVDVVRQLRDMGLTKQGPSLRACIMIGRIAAQQGAHARRGDTVFSEICHDVLGGLAPRVVHDGKKGIHSMIDEIIAKCAKDERRPVREIAVGDNGTAIAVKKEQRS